MTLQTVTSDPATAPALVQTDSFLTLHYRITLVKDGELLGDFLSTFDDKPATLLMGAGQLSPGLEAALIGLPAGTHTTLDIAPNVAFGERNPDMVQRVSRSLLKAEAEFGTDFELGDVVEFNAPKGGRMAGVLKSLDADSALFDFNHPLAGQAVQFEVKLIAVL